MLNDKELVCSNCGSKNVEFEDADENALEDMTDGQRSDYEAGFNNDLYCNDCHTLEMRDRYFNS
jgi:hypothetical protein